MNNNSRADARAPTNQSQHLINQHSHADQASVVSCEEFVNARGPFQFRITYEAYRESDCRSYVKFLRRTIKSANTYLIRKAGFPYIKDSNLQSNLHMLEGMIILHGHDPKPFVEIVCNVNQQHCLFTPQTIAAAFIKSGCYESPDQPYPLLNDSTVRVCYLVNGEWDDAYLQDIPYILSLNGRRCVMEY